MIREDEDYSSMGREQAKRKYRELQAAGKDLTSVRKVLIQHKDQEEKEYQSTFSQNHPPPPPNERSSISRPEIEPPVTRHFFRYHDIHDKSLKKDVVEAIKRHHGIYHGNQDIYHRKGDILYRRSSYNLSFPHKDPGIETFKRLARRHGQLEYLGQSALRPKEFLNMLTKFRHR